jgi:hypothetical protein
MVSVTVPYGLILGFLDQNRCCPKRYSTEMLRLSLVDRKAASNVDAVACVREKPT